MKGAVRLRASMTIAFACCAVLSGCSSTSHVAPITATINENASLSDPTAKTLPANPLQWQIITMAIDSSAKTMSTLYGNDIAVKYARSNPKHDYAAESIIALVTWTQRDDPRYFGATIPDRLESIEFVSVKSSSSNVAQYSYEKFEGRPLTMTPTEEGPTATPRIAYLLSQRAAVLP